MYRVTFPFELRLPSDGPDEDEPELRFLLKGVVVHVGSGPNHGGPARGASRTLPQASRALRALHSQQGGAWPAGRR